MTKSLVVCALALMPMTALADNAIGSLTELSTESLRARSYEGAFTGAAKIDCPGSAAGATSLMLSYSSDGLGLYARLELPAAPAPAGGYPVVLFLHGYVGADAAPDYPFSCNEGGYYAPVINAWADAGYAVLMPGYRGHGTVAGKPADGHDWITTWDNGTYLSPVFYAVDALNLLAAAPGIGGLGIDTGTGPVQLDLSKVHAVGHSQGGDVGAIVLAATGEGAANGLSVASGALWSGTYVDRFTQLQTYPPMETALEAFMAGDGIWTGTATGADGKVNPNFVFGYPPNWIGTLDQANWDWQKDQWSAPSVRAAVEIKLDEMYATLNAQVKDAGQWSWAITERADGGFTVVHDARLVPLMRAIGAFDLPQYMKEPLNLHFSDRDFYSAPDVNIALCENANAAGGTCQAFEYPGNTHELTKAAEAWFSPEGTTDGWPLMLRRDQALISGQDPRAVE
jgi:pimeloyl-ACP methyl ester carboxylesterase